MNMFICVQCHLGKTMPDQSNTEKLIINPAFKKQLLLLKKAAATELKIEISLNKMVSDNKYRNTFLNELDGLGSETFNALVSEIKKIPVYIDQAPVAELNIATPPTSEEAPEKKKKSLFPLIGYLFILLLIGLSAWKLGYINFSSKNETTTSTASSQTTASQPSKAEVVIPTAEVKEVPVVTPTPELKLPSDNSVVSFRLDGSNSMSEDLLPALLEGYLRKQGVTEMKWLANKAQFEYELQYIKDQQVFSIELDAHGSTYGFKALLNDEADFSMSSRKISEAEIEMLRPKFGNLSFARNEYILALDGIAIIVNPENPIKALSNDVVAKVFSGEINNWQALGGADAPINLYSRDTSSGTWQTFNENVLNVHNVTMSEKIKQVKSSSQLSELVADDINAIGFVSLPYIQNSKKIALAASQETSPLYPTRFTVSTEDYLLSRRLYLYMPSNTNPFIKGFSQFVVSDEGQTIVEKIGLVSQNIKLQNGHKVANAPQSYNDFVETAKRLSIDFRFTSGSNDLDNKGKRDIKRLVDFISKNPNHRIILMGFSDSMGDEAVNQSLSLVRSRELEKELNSYGVDVSVIKAFGSQIPIASNHSAIGRSKNRRVEVWVY